MHQFVVGRTQERMACVPAPARAVDHTLRMLDAKAHRKRLGLHGHATRPEHGKSVACAVAQCHHHVVGLQLLHGAAGQVQHFKARDATHLALCGGADVGHPLAKSHLTAQFDDARAQVLHHLDQLESADVGVGFHQYFGGRACSHKLLHHLASQVARVFDLAPELAVRKRACAAFAKLHIALRVKRVFAPQVPGVFGALSYGGPTLQHQGSKPHLCQQQRRKHAAGAKAHHHRSLWQGRLGLTHQRVGHVGRWANVGVVGELRHQARLEIRGERHIHDEHRQQIGLAGVKAAFENVQCLDVGHGHAQGLRSHAGQCRNRLRQRATVFVGFAGRVGSAPHVHGQCRKREFEFGNSQHVQGSGLSSKLLMIRKANKWAQKRVQLPLATEPPDCARISTLPTRPATCAYLVDASQIACE